MLKLFTVALLLSSALQASATNKTVEKFLKSSFSKNPNIKSLTIKVVSKTDVEDMKGWNAFIVDILATLKKDNRVVKQKMIWFSNGQVITQELINIKSGESLKDMVTPPFRNSFYKKENLIYGNANAKHKVAIFSDPLCPFCKSFVPNAIEYMKKKPNMFAVYYYHFPLPSLHPAAVELVKAAHVIELQGKKDVVLNLYKVKLKNPRERSVPVILRAFNKTFGTHVTPADLDSKEVKQRYAHDLQIAQEVMVQGTPTIFFDGKIDKSKKKYLKAN